MVNLLIATTISLILTSLSTLQIEIPKPFCTSLLKLSCICTFKEQMCCRFLLVSYRAHNTRELVSPNVESCLNFSFLKHQSAIEFFLHARSPNPLSITILQFLLPNRFLYVFFLMAPNPIPPKQPLLFPTSHNL